MKLNIVLNKVAATLSREQIISNIDTLIQDLMVLHERISKETSDPSNPATKSEHVNRAKSDIEKAVVDLKSQRGHVERLGESIFLNGIGK